MRPILALPMCAALLGWAGRGLCGTPEKGAGPGGPREEATASFGSRLEFTIERFGFDDEARTQYEILHPPPFTLADQLAKLITFRASLKQYKDWLRAADEIIRQLFAGVPRSKASRIDEAFAPVDLALKSNLEEVTQLIASRGGASVAVPVNPDLIAAWHGLGATLANLNLPSEPKEMVKSISTVLSQLQGKGKELQQLVDKARKALEGLELDSQVLAKSKTLLSDLETAASRKAEVEPVVAQLGENTAQAQENTKQAAAELQQASGDLLPRLHTVYQDLSDPFLGYIAQRPELWQRIPNQGSVHGDGDTQFILVFEDQLDGRFNFVSVDPTKVIQARLRIGRKVAQNLIALAGVATKAFGVPIPTGLDNGQTASNSDTIDFSKMTALETQIKKQNEMAQGNIEALRAFAVQTLVNFPNDATKAEELRKDLIRRLQPYVTP